MLLFVRAGLAAACALVITTASTMADDAALDDATVRDVHCFIVYMQMGANVQEPNLRMAMVMGSTYFMGKIDGRMPKLDLENAVLAESPKLAGDTYRTEVERCGQELQARGEAERAMGNDLQQKATQMQHEENSR